MDSEIYDQYKVQDALQQSQMDNQVSQYAPQLTEMVDQSRAVLVEQTDPKNIIKEI